jgi:GDP-mannose 6-dehydrogenase
LLSSILPSNRRRIEQALEAIAEHPGRRLAFIGLSFKAGSDDLRESPYVEVAERLLGKGFDLKIYDPDLDPHRLVGANMAHVMGRLPHLARILVDSPEAACVEADAMVVGKRILPDEMIQKYAASGMRIFDLQKMAHGEFKTKTEYGPGPSSASPE